MVPRSIVSPRSCAAAAALSSAIVAAAFMPAATRADGGARAEGVTSGFGAVWTTGSSGLVRIDPRTGRIAARVHAPASGVIPTLTAGEGGVWMLARRRVTRIDPAQNRVVGRPITLRRSSVAMAAGAGGLWVADYDDGILRMLEPRTGRPLATVKGVGQHVEAIVATPRTIWVASIGAWTQNRHGEITPSGPGTVARIDVRTNRVVARIPVGRGPSALTVGAGSVWVANSRGLRPSFSISRIDTRSNRVTATFELHRLLAGITASGGYVWSVNPGRMLRGGGLDMSGGTLIRIDPRTGRVVVRRLRGSARPAAITFSDGALWVGSPGNGSILRVNPKTMEQRRIPIPFR